MTTYRYPHENAHAPLILLVPGTPPDAVHWMSDWASRSENCHILELGLWDEPHRNTWVNKLNLAIRRADRPVIVVTDGIGALALAWWVQFEQIASDSAVLGAIVANPPNVDLPGADRRLERFGACPRQALPFKSFIVSDLNGSVEHQRSIMRLAGDWGSCPVFDETAGSWAAGWDMLHAVFGLKTASSVASAVIREGQVCSARYFGVS